MALKCFTLLGFVLSSALLITTSAHASQSKTSDAAVSSPQACPPSGYFEVPPEARTTQKNGELLYCVKDAPTEWWFRTKCAKYVPAQEYVKAVSKRPDAIYSGMALRGSVQPTIVLFYCLPAK